MVSERRQRPFGQDPIFYRMISRFPNDFNTLLLALYQDCWTQGQLPDAWRESLVVGIPKEGSKPPQQLSSYRHIALTPYLGKIYERIITKRLEYHLTKHDILPRCQAGFK